uniref:Uncharacterized protein n=1 Tax=Magallana gigas TaxID=29159 RepID=K1Q0T2_MAGGI
MNNKRMVQLLTDNGVMATPGTLYRADIYGDDYITGRVLQTRDADFYTPQQQHTLIYSAVVKGTVAPRSSIRIFSDWELQTCS